MLMLIIITWYVIGVVSFVYWWTEQYDLRVGDLTLVALVAIIGPLALLMGWTMYGKSPSKPIIKRKEK